jgi:hypothetical protein
MKKATLISLIITILFISCEKGTEQPYTLRFYGDAYEDIGYSVSIVSDGYVIAGQFTGIIRQNHVIANDSSNKNMAIIKAGWGGDVIWKVSTGGKFDDWGSKIYQLTDKSLICTGTFTDTTTTDPVQTDIFIVKVSSTGTILWQKTYGGTGNQTGRDIIETSDGFMILGTTDVERQPITDSTGNIAGNTDIFLLKIDNNGDLVESFAYGYPGNDLGNVIKADNGGNFIVFGTTDMSDPGQDKNNLILVRFNSVGYATESNIIGGSDDEYAADMEVLSDGYLIAATIGKDGESQKIYVTKLKNDIYADPYFTNDKIVISDPNFPNIKSSGVYALSKYKTDSFVLAGYTGTGSSAKMLIFEMDADGNLVEGHQIIKGSTGTQVAYDVVSGDDGYIIAVGKNSYDVNSMVTFLKFRF